MSAQNNPEDPYTTKIFHAANIKGWKKSSDPLSIKHGGQAKVWAVENEDGRQGVLRYLKDRNTLSLQRFFREIKILTNPRFQHQNIVKILDYSNDEKTPWYISKLGESFEDYWNVQRELYQDDPESLLREALTVVRQLLDGLRPLHKENVVHRDIKPENIIVIQSDSRYSPALIDFGLVHIDDEDRRLTTEDSAVGNARFSPDVMMNRMDEIVPWLDVFQMSQLLIWMVSKGPTKIKWQRPLHWQWVNYDPRLSNNSVDSIRSLTALCSEESTSPKDAAELSVLINNLFVSPKKSLEEEIDFTEITNAHKRYKAIEAFKNAQDRSSIDSSYIAAKQIYESLRTEVENLLAHLVSEAWFVNKERDISFESFYKAITGPVRKDHEILYKLAFGDIRSDQFYFQIFCRVHLPGVSIPSEPLPDTSNIFAFNLARHSINIEGFSLKSVWITYERTGELTLRDEKMLRIETTDIPTLGGMILSWVLDPDPWKHIKLIT